MGLKAIIQTLEQLDDVATNNESPSLDALVAKAKAFVQYLATNDDAMLKAFILECVNVMQSKGFLD